MLEFITDRQIYEKVILGKVSRARRFVWLATADLKDLYVNGRGGMIPFLEVLSERVRENVEIRLLHSKEPGPAFRRDFDRYPNLINGMERILCPRVHFKCIVIDGVFAYTGSANLTGAGVGAKSIHRRNFESGIMTDQPDLIDCIAEQFDQVWRGQYCGECGRKDYCSDFRDILAGR